MRLFFVVVLLMSGVVLAEAPKLEAQIQKEKFEIPIDSVKLPFGEKPSFQITPGEDLNITTIRKFYFALANGELGLAYDFLMMENKIPFDKFEEIYKGVKLADPYQFERVDGDRYRFSLHYQGCNVPSAKYQITMVVHDGKISINLIERVVGEIATFRDKSAFAVNRNGKDVLILLDNKKEEVIATSKGDRSVKFDEEVFAKLDQDGQGCGDSNVFHTVSFSPQGTHIVYASSEGSCESAETFLYDIHRKQNYPLRSLILPKFTDDQQYIYGCREGSVWGDGANEN